MKSSDNSKVQRLYNINRRQFGYSVMQDALGLSLAGGGDFSIALLERKKSVLRSTYNIRNFKPSHALVINFSINLLTLATATDRDGLTTC
jgi:hypothetical protein